MNPDLDGFPAGEQAAPAAPAEDIDVKKILLLQDEMIKKQAAQIADLSKQISAIAARPAVAPAAAAEVSPQDRAFEAMLKSYGLVKAEKKED